jgi:hypothetical protein
MRAQAYSLAVCDAQRVTGGAVSDDRARDILGDLHTHFTRSLRLDHKSSRFAGESA